MAGENVPVRFLQGGSVLEVAASGTINVLAGGSIQNAGGISLGGSVAFSGSASFTGAVGAPNLALGGTLARWSFGTAGLTSGVGTIATGMTRVVSANANAILGEAQAAGSASHVMIDLSLSGAGSVIYRLGSVGGAVWAANGTIAWQAFGT